MKKQLIFLLILFIFLILSGCQDSEQNQEEKSKDSKSVIIPGENGGFPPSDFEWRHPFGPQGANPFFDENARLINPEIIRHKFPDAPIIWVVGSNIDGDGKGEIVAVDENGLIRVLDFENNEIYQEELSNDGISSSSPVLGDINGDGLDDIVFISHDGKINVRISPDENHFETEFQASTISFPLLVDMDNDSKGEIIFNGENQRINLLKFENGTFMRYLEEDTPLLPDSRISSGDIDGDGKIELVSLAYPTERYPHGPLGDITEAGGVAAFSFNRNVLKKKYSYILPTDSVFEGLTPIIVPMVDGKKGVLLSRSYLTKGSAVVLFGIEDELKIIAEGPPIGRPFGWIHSIAGADFDMDDEIELVAVRTPHIGGILQIYEIQGNELRIAFDTKFYSSHGSGSRNLNIPLVGDFDGDDQIEVIIPDQSRKKIIMLGLEGDEILEKWSFQLDGEISSNSMMSDLNGDGLGDLALGDSDGNFYVFISR